jgi:nucleotide-binding universal stress UspA family protein
MREPSSPPTVVVGIDGSRAALCAALWAVEEAVSRNVALRLICAVDPRDTSRIDPDDAAGRLAAAEIAVRDAVMAVQATHKPVKIVVEIVQDCPISALVRASRAAAMVCVGAAGIKHFEWARVGSTATALAASAACPVAIIRGHDGPARPGAGSIMVVTDTSPDNDVLLEQAMNEARLRQAPLRALTCWQSRYTDSHDRRAVADGNREVRTALDRRMARWTRRYPGVDVESVPVHGSIVDYLAKNADTAQLVVVGAGDGNDVGQLVGPTGNAALHHTDCSVLVVDRRDR